MLERTVSHSGARMYSSQAQAWTLLEQSSSKAFSQVEPRVSQLPAATHERLW
jgi:hypothetical protein